MSEAIKSQGIEVKRGDGQASESFTLIGEVVSIDGPGGQAQVIDVTHLKSTAKEKLMGLADEGQVSLGLNLVPGNAQQTGLRTDRDNQTLRNFQIVLTDSGTTTLSFAAFVLGFSISASVDAKVDASVTLEVSGAVTWA